MNRHMRLLAVKNPTPFTTYLAVNEHGVIMADDVWVPAICKRCHNFDEGEIGDYGQRFSGPYCMANVWWPTKKGTCKKRDPQVGVSRTVPTAYDPNLINGYIGYGDWNVPEPQERKVRTNESA